MPEQWRKNVVAVTGTIGSGKSTVARMFADLGAYVVSADDLAREAVKRGSPGLKRITEAFGAHILTAKKTLNRRKLAAIVFTNPHERRRLEKIIHPIIRKLAKQKFIRAYGRHPMLVYEVPLLFEARMNPRDFKAVIVVAASKETSIRRLMNNKRLSRTAAIARLGAQIPLEKKIKFADYVIRNTGSLTKLRSQVKQISKQVA